MTNSWIEFRKSLLQRKVVIILVVMIVSGILARLFHANAPLFDWHFYRQYDTAAIARNFHEGQMNILYPQVDWRGSSPGYVEAEFQIYTFLVALLYNIFGPYEWLGRILNIIFYALSAILLFRFTSRVFEERTGLFAVFFYSFVPLSFFFSRSFQPDALLALCSLAGVYYFWIWIEGNQWKSLALSALGISIAILIKPPSLYLGLPLFYLCYQKFGIGLFRKFTLWLFAIAVLFPPFLWYYHAFQLWKTYGNTLGIFGIHTIMGIWPLTDHRWLSLGKGLLLRLTFEIATPPGLLLLFVGFLTKPLRRTYLMLWWTAGFAIYILLVPWGHFAHDYYQLPIVFITSAYMAFGATLLLDRNIFSRVVIYGVCLALLGFSAWQLHTMIQVSDMHWKQITFGKRVNHLTEPDALVIFAADQFFPFPPELFRHRTADGEYLYCDPIDFYLSHRKGWSIVDVQASPEFIDTLRKRGAKYFATFYPKKVLHQGLKTALDRSYKPVELTPHWAIYRLEDPSAVKISKEKP